MSLLSIEAALLAVALVSAVAWLLQFALLLGYRAVHRTAVSGRPSGSTPRGNSAAHAEGPSAFATRLGLASAKRIAVHMPVRGTHPELAKVIRSVLAQDYPDFEVRIVVDDQRDPAWAIARDELQRHGCGRAELRLLGTRLDTCSLVCSSLVEYLEDLGDSADLLAFAAGDVVLPTDWLSRMAPAFEDRAVGLTLGSRWYLPPLRRWGSLVRHLWNAAAIIPMEKLEIPWAGALMLRVADVHESGLAKLWRRAMVEDVSVAEPLRRLGREARFLHGQIAGVSGELSLGGCWNFLCRQLLWTRLYHRSWWKVVVVAWALVLIVLAPLALAITAGLLHRPLVGLLAVAALVAYLTGMWFLHRMMEAAVHSALDRSVRSDDLAADEKEGTASATGMSDRSPVAPHLQSDGQSFLRILLAIPLTVLMHALAVSWCSFARHVTWRGVRYRIDGPWDVTLLDYRPLVAAEPVAGHRDRVQRSDS